MSDINREEVKARLEASEARVAMSAEIIRSEMSQLRSEMSMHAERAQASADKFYTEAGKVLAEIRLSNAEHKVAMYGVGYKVIAWTLGTILAFGSVGLGAWKAIKDASPPHAPAQQTMPAPASSSKQP
ncbi:hypothetical protein [Xanthomonas citri]|uniref:hypothetical protein n=1 Tax=Xanthomonas citri TaxID=346 RepID=UPI00103FD357|nr:hypothetical protein [Xanthomonas citri]MCC8492167.1 hypothetical protein [Xanthomonas citri pv. fuscans]